MKRFLDLADSPANNFAGVRITTPPTSGILTIDVTTALGAGAFVNAAQITGSLRFVPASGGNGTPYATFTFRMQDSGSSTAPNVNTDPNANLFTFNVTAVNDPPLAADSTVATSRMMISRRTPPPRRRP